jgi:hypothetical protein
LRAPRRTTPFAGCMPLPLPGDVPLSAVRWRFPVSAAGARRLKCGGCMISGDKGHADRAPLGRSHGFWIGQQSAMTAALRRDKRPERCLRQGSGVSSMGGGCPSLLASPPPLSSYARDQRCVIRFTAASASTRYVRIAAYGEPQFI